MVGQTIELFVGWTLTGNQVLMGITTIAVGATAIGLGMRLHLNRRSQQLNGSTDLHFAPLDRKHQALDTAHHRLPLRIIGGICAMAFVATVLAWTYWEDNSDLAMGNLDVPEELLMEPPTVAPRPPLVPELPPPPPPTEKVIITDEQIDEPDLIDRTPDEHQPVYDPNNNTGGSGNGALTVVAPPVVQEPEPEPVQDDDKAIPFAEQMPRFPGCEDMEGTNADKKTCADKALLAFIYRNVKYPEMARSSGVSGMVVVSFEVAKNGAIENIQIVKDPGAGLGKEAVRVVNRMNELNLRWTPGKQNGRPVRVKYNLPVRFNIE